MNDANGIPLTIGDDVFVEKNVAGRIVCDYDRKSCLPGYENWFTDDELVGGGRLSGGVMVETAEWGFVHYSEADEDIVLRGEDRAPRAGPAD